MEAASIRAPARGIGPEASCFGVRARETEQGRGSALTFRTMALLCTLAFATSFAGSLVIHASAIAAHARGVAPMLIGLGTAAQALGIVVAAPIAVLLLRRLGSAQVVVGALCVAASALALALASTASDIAQESAARFVFALGTGSAVTVSEYVLTARAPAGRRSLLIAVYATCFAGGAAVGPIAVSWVDGSAPILAIAGLVLAAFLVLFWGDFRSRVEDRSSAGLGTVFRLAPVAFTAALVYGFLDSGFLGSVASLALGYGYSGSDAAQIASAGLFGVLLLQIPLGFVADRVTPKRFLPACALITVLLLLILPSCAGTKLGLCVSLFILGGMIDVFYTVGLAALSSEVPSRHLAAANGGVVALCGAGEIFGPVAAGSGLELGGTPALVFIFATAMAAYYLAMRGPTLFSHLRRSLDITLVPLSRPLLRRENRRIATIASE